MHWWVGLPPCSTARHPGVVAVLEPADRRHEVQGTRQSPDAAQLAQNPVDGCRPDEPTPAWLSGDQDGRVRHADELDSVVGVVALDPARPPNSKVAGAVVHQRQPGIRHEANLHSRRMSGLDLPERYNVAADLLQRNLKAGRGKKVAINHAGGEVTYDELYRLAAGAGRALLDHGVRREERVVIVAYDSPGWVAAFLGA